MAFDFANTIANARRTVHRTMGVEATYTEPGQTVPVGEVLHVRWHNRLLIQGNLVDTGYADVIEGVNRLIFNREELAEKSITLKRGGRITLTNPLYEGAVLVLGAKEPLEGPVNEIWEVAAP